MKKLLLKQIFAVVLLASSSLVAENSLDQNQEPNIDIVVEVKQIIVDLLASFKKHLANFDTQSLHDDMPNMGSAVQENKNDVSNQAIVLKPEENIEAQEQLTFNGQSSPDNGALPAIETDQMLSADKNPKEVAPTIIASQEPLHNNSLSNDGIKQENMDTIQTFVNQDNTLGDSLNTEKNSMLDTIQKAGAITVEAVMITCISYALLNYMINKLPKTSKLAFKKQIICCTAAALACAGSIALQTHGYAAQNILSR